MYSCHKLPLALTASIPVGPPCTQEGMETVVYSPRPYCSFMKGVRNPDLNCRLIKNTPDVKLALAVTLEFFSELRTRARHVYSPCLGADHVTHGLQGASDVCRSSFDSLESASRARASALNHDDTRKLIS